MCPWSNLSPRRTSQPQLHLAATILRCTLPDQAQCSNLLPCQHRQQQLRERQNNQTSPNLRWRPERTLPHLIPSDSPLPRPASNQLPHRALQPILAMLVISKIISLLRVAAISCLLLKPLVGLSFSPLISFVSACNGVLALYICIHHLVTPNVPTAWLTSRRYRSKFDSAPTFGIQRISCSLPEPSDVQQHAIHLSAFRFATRFSSTVAARANDTSVSDYSSVTLSLFTVHDIQHIPPTRI